MKKSKRYLVLVILIIPMISTISITNFGKTEAYAVSDHKTRAVEFAYDLLCSDYSQLPSNDPKRVMFNKLCMEELIGQWKNTLETTQSWADDTTYVSIDLPIGGVVSRYLPIRSLNHFWDPIDLEPMNEDIEILLELYVDITQDIVGAPLYAERYFNYAVEYYKADVYDNYPEPTIPTDFDEFSVGDGGLWDKLAPAGTKQRAYICLGVALHVLQDVTCPVHAVNTIEESKVILDPDISYGEQEHAEIESAMLDFTNYMKDNSLLDFAAMDGLYGPKEDWNGDYNIKGWIHQAALVGRGENDETYNTICDLSLNNPYYYDDTWDRANKALLEYSVAASTGFLLYFWQYVPHRDSETSPIYYYDADEDGLLIFEEENYGTNYMEFDTDGDGLGDGDEVLYWNEENHESNCDEDFDQDGLINILDPDSDNDILEDGYEINVLGTNPANTDSDFDDLSDMEEINADWGYYTDPTNDDTDEDGYPDGDEIFEYSTDPTNPNDNPSYSWVPETVIGFSGESDQISTIDFDWDPPANLQTGWYYLIWRKPQYYGTYVSLTPTPLYVTQFQNSPPSLYTSYIYRIACFNLNGQQGPYSYWTGKVKSQGGGQGGGGGGGG